MNLILKKIIGLSAGSVTGGGLNFISFFLAAKYIGPSAWGVWLTLNMILKFSPVVQLGVTESAQRLIPIKIIQKKEKYANKVSENVFSFITLICIFLIPFFILIIYFSINEGLRHVYLIFIPIFIMNLYFSFFGMLLRAHDKFSKLAKVNLFNGILTLNTIVLAYYFQLEGFLYGIIIKYVIILLYTYKIAGFKLNIHFETKMLKALIRTGVSIMIIVFSVSLFTLADRMIILSFFDEYKLGVYGLGALLITPLLLISSSINSIFYTKYSQQYGAGQLQEKLSGIFDFSVYATAIFALIISYILLLSPVIVEYLLVDYRSGLIPAQILLIGFLFYVSVGLFNSIFIVIQKQNYRILIIFLVLILNVFLAVLFIKFNLGIIGVALANAISNFVLFWITIFSLVYIFKMPPFKFINYVKEVSMVPLLSFIIIILSYYFKMHNDLLVDIAIKLAIYTVLMSASIYILLSYGKIKKLSFNFSD